jgi:hypothetical protein
MNALAIDKSINIEDYTLPEGVALLDLNNESTVIEWILNNAKEL